MKTLAQRLAAAAAKQQRQHPEAVIGLNFGASDDDFAALEEMIGAKLPEEVKAVYREHNGQLEDGANLFDGEEWLSLERIADEWQVWKDLYDKGTFAENFGAVSDDGVRSLWWTPAWIPFTYDGAGNHLCWDLNPSASGRYGQIVRVWHDDEERPLEATSFDEWLEAYVEGMEASDYQYVEEYDAVMDMDSLYDDEDEFLDADEKRMMDEWLDSEDDLLDALGNALGDGGEEADFDQVRKILTERGLWDDEQNELWEQADAEDKAAKENKSPKKH